MRKLFVLVAAVLMIPGVASAGGGGYVSNCPGFATGNTISMLDSCFNGVAQFAPSDSTLLIRNDGQLPHTYTAVDGSFDSGQLAPGETFEIIVDEPRMIQVFCSLHGTAQGDGMAGVLIVGESEPLAVSAPANLAVFKQAVSAETESLSTLIGRIPATIKNLTTTQDELINALQEGSVPGGTTQPVVAVAPEESPSDFWLPLATGAAIGLSMAALFMVDRSRRRSESVDGVEGLVPSLDT